MRLSIIIPYRARSFYLKLLLKELPNYLLQNHGLKEQDYNIVIAEQIDGGLFNRGRSINVGLHYLFNENLCDYVVVHDVDILPLRNIDYTYTNKNYFWFIVAGGQKMANHSFQNVNGYSNQYQGWGYEDSDFVDRLIFFQQDKSFWPSQGAQDKAVSINLEFGAEASKHWSNFSTENASHKYFMDNKDFRESAGGWNGYPRFLSPKEADYKLPDYSVDKYRSWYLKDRSEENKNRHLKICSMKNTKRQNTYLSDGLSNIKNKHILSGDSCRNIHRVCFFNS